MSRPKMTHAQQLAYYEALPHPRVQKGGGLQVPVLQMGGSLNPGLGSPEDADHRIIGMVTPQVLDPTLAPAPTLPSDPAEQANMSRQAIVQERLGAGGIQRPEL